MTILSVVQDAATSLGLNPVPDQVFGSTRRDMVEMRSVIKEVSRQIAEAHDWSVLKTIHTITGDGSDEDFSLPADYDRMPKDIRFWSSLNTTAPLQHILSEDEWLGITVQGFDPLYGAWIVYGGEIHIKPARASGETVKFFYISDKIVTASGGSTKAAFSADDDTFRLPERLLKLGIIWNWKARKGHEYAEEMATYSDALMQLTGKDKGPSIITVGQQRLPYNIHYAYPLGLGS